MLADERQKYIMDMLNKKGAVTTEELVEALNVSASTVRNDLNALAEKKLLKKKYGGAVQMKNNPFNFMNFHYREQIYLEEKDAIALKLSNISMTDNRSCSMLPPPVSPLRKS